MDGALAWISEIANWVGQFIPRWFLLDTTEAAVKFRARLPRPWGEPGQLEVIALGPGLHGYWPVTSKIQLYPTARQAEELRGQTITTTDDKTIVVGGMIVYEVHDVEKILAHTFQAQQTIRDITLTAVHDVCCRMSWADLRDEQRKGTLDTKLRNEAKKALDSYGVTVLKLMLTDLAPCRVLKLIQSMSKGED